jgi:peptidoglycan/LPS O-acetylase OafA/YrhL
VHFWTLFFLGAIAHLLRARIRLSWGLLLATFALMMAVMPFPAVEQARAVFVGYGVLCAGILTARVRAVSAGWSDYSYGMYIFAFPVMMVAQVVWRPASPYLLALETALVTLPIAAVSWHFVEKPALDFFRSQLRRRARPMAQPATVRKPV